jgi:hypothetical protein
MIFGFVDLSETFEEHEVEKNFEASLAVEQKFELEMSLQAMKY